METSVLLAPSVSEDKQQSTYSHYKPDTKKKHLISDCIYLVDTEKPIAD